MINPFNTQTSQQSNHYKNFIHFDKPFIQLGDILQDSSISFYFSYTNISSFPINLQFKSSCGCTVVQVTKTKLLPGQGGRVMGHFFSKSYEGPVTKYIYIIDKDKQFLYKYPIYATIYPDFYLSRKNIFIPSLHKCKKQFLITLKSKKYSAFNITKMKYNKQLFDIHYSHTTNGYNINILINTESDKNIPNYFNEKILISTIPKSKKEIVLTVMGYK